MNKAELIKFLENAPNVPVNILYEADGEQVFCEADRLSVLEYVSGEDRFHNKEDYSPIPQTEEALCSEHYDLLWDLYPYIDWDIEPVENVLEKLNNIKWEKAIFIS